MLHDGSPSLGRCRHRAPGARRRHRGSVGVGRLEGDMRGRAVARRSAGVSTAPPLAAGSGRCWVCSETDHVRAGVSFALSSTSGQERRRRRFSNMVRRAFLATIARMWSDVLLANGSQSCSTWCTSVKSCFRNIARTFNPQHPCPPTKADTNRAAGRLLTPEAHETRP